MKKTLVIAAAALALIGCNSIDNSLNVNAPESAIAAKKGVSAPNTTIGSAITVTTSARSYIEYLTVPKNVGNSSNDYCDNGAYMKAFKGSWTQTGGVPHAQCINVVNEEATTYTVNFDLTANYVLSTSSNIQLNFQTCGNELGCSGVYVHYTKSQNVTAGSGVLVGVAEEDGSVWTIDLTQINHVTNAGIENGTRALGPVLATDADGKVGSAVIAW